jgi:hypothetical protein
MSSIRGINVLAPVVPFDTTDSHASHEARYGKGGYRSVADIGERDAIPSLRRESGMLVCVLTDGKVWKLGSDLTTWSEFAVASDWATLSGKPSTFPPTSHTHTASQITDFSSAVAAAAPPTTDASLLTTGTLAAARLPASVVLTSDSRLSDARTPTTHSHAVADVTGLQTALDSKQAAGSYAAASHTHSYADLSGKPSLFSGSYADLTSVPSTFTPAAHNQAWSTITATPTTLSGYGITDAVGSSDSRLADSRTPTIHVHGNITNAGAIGSASGQIVVTTTSGALTTAATIAASAVTGLPTAGTGSTNYCAGNDSRLSDSRTPTSHASSHASGGADAITPSSIGAAASSHTHAASDIASGTLSQARLDFTPFHPFLLMGG